MANKTTTEMLAQSFRSKQLQQQRERALKAKLHSLRTELAKICYEADAFSIVLEFSLNKNTDSQRLEGDIRTFENGKIAFKLTKNI